MKSLSLALLFVIVAGLSAIAQEKQDSDLFKSLKSRDSLLFDVGFNKCDIAQFEALVSDDLEFYHDQGGITRGKTDFINSIRNGICKLSYKPRRELVEGSLEVYPMYDNGVLYAAIQTGEHRFYAIEKDKPEYLTSTARFVHLWKLEKGEWKLARALSFDHVPAK